MLRIGLQFFKNLLPSQKRILIEEKFITLNFLNYFSHFRSIRFNVIRKIDKHSSTFFISEFKKYFDKKIPLNCHYCDHRLNTKDCELIILEIYVLIDILINMDTILIGNRSTVQYSTVQYSTVQYSNIYTYTHIHTAYTHTPYIQLDLLIKNPHSVT